MPNEDGHLTVGEAFQKRFNGRIQDYVEGGEIEFLEEIEDLDTVWDYAGIYMLDAIDKTAQLLYVLNQLYDYENEVVSELVSNLQVAYSKLQ